jgi:hypothetical protein
MDMRKILSQRYVHYGHSSFEKALFREARNSQLPEMKPRGCFFWASPLETDDWRDWCRENEFPSKKAFPIVFSSRFEFGISESARILAIGKLSDIPKKYIIHKIFENTDFMGMDYIMIAKDYDAIYFEENEDTDSYLGSWDVTTLAVINPDIIINGKGYKKGKEE